MGNLSSSLPENSDYLQISKNYKALQYLGEGGFGLVAKCLKKDTGELVAVKVPLPDQNLHKEELMMRFLMDHNLDKFNIIKYDGKISVSGQTGLVFELLDITLQEYLLTLDDFIPMGEVKSIIQQMATACDALERVGVIHTDIKIDNILLVDHHRHPLRVKLIDFGLAIFQVKARQGNTHQTPEYRAPEILLGLPFSEAIDIWSLGCVMAVMMFGVMLFPARVDFEALCYITELIGPVPAHIVSEGQKSSLFYKKTGPGQWILMTPEEFYHSPYLRRDNRTYKFCSLDEAKALRQKNMEDDEEWSECIELLKAILRWDDRQRITAAGILNHPFISRGNLNTSPLLSPSEALPSGVTMVQPAPCMNRLTPGEAVHEDRTWCQQCCCWCWCCCFPSSSPTPYDSRDQEDEGTNSASSVSG